MNAFYKDPTVRKRLEEFLGGDALEHATTVYITSADGHPYDTRTLHLPSELGWFLDRDLDIARSLADTEAVLLHVDLEYVNFDSPLEAYLNPERAFALQEPVVHVLEALLLEWGIRPLHLITGQGHHFVWKIPAASEVAGGIEALCPAPELVERCQDRVPPLLRAGITAKMQSTFAGLALLMEYLAHRVKTAAAKRSEIPVELTAVHVGPARTGRREIVSVDISEYGDPLQTRMIRMPFTNYLKPKLRQLAETSQLDPGISELRTIPLYEIDTKGALKLRMKEGEVRELASRACVRIPEQTPGTVKLLEAYLASRLRRFHEYFYTTRHHLPEQWPETYGNTPVESLPPCVRRLLAQPNDLLLKPAGMQLVTRTLLAHDWHPRHIAGYIRSKFEDPSHGWGLEWGDYEAGTRADFYVRIFAGLYETGLDRLVDFNCVSTQEKGFCLQPDDAGPCLAPLYQTLVERQCQ